MTNISDLPKWGPYEELRADYQALTVSLHGLWKENNLLRAEIERLRLALEKIVIGCVDPLAVAREALGVIEQNAPTAADDRTLYGTSYERKKPDGTLERIDPSEIVIRKR